MKIFASSSLCNVGLLLMSLVFVEMTCPLSSANDLLVQPVAEKQDFSEVLFGKKVNDPYRYFENWRDEKPSKWIKAQDDYTRSTLLKIPGREKFLKRVQSLDQANTRVREAQIAGGKLFYLKSNAGDDNLKLYVMDQSTSKERLLVDPTLLTQNGVHSSIDYLQPSLDGKYLAYGISPGGSEQSVLHVLTVSTGKVFPDAIDRTTWPMIAWLPGGKSFAYSRMQKMTPDMPADAKEKNTKVYIHQLGQKVEQDRFSFGFAYPDASSPNVKVDEKDLSGTFYSPLSPYLFGVIHHGTKKEHTVYYTPAKLSSEGTIPWKKLFGAEDAVVSFDVHGDDLYLLTHRKNSRRELIKTSLKNPDLEHASVVVPASDRVMQEIAVASDGVYIRDLDAGIGKIRKLSFAGQIEEVSIGEGKSASEMAVSPTRPGVIVQTVSWISPPNWILYDPKLKITKDTKTRPAYPIDTSGYESLEVKAKSKDGTLVPLSIIKAKNLKLDGSHPTHVIGYGSYGFSYEPRFDPAWIAWLERGGVIAFAHVRGGGENGDDWYQAGYKLKKQNTIDDFIGCAQYMIDHQYTNKTRLSGEGTSAGGILIGGAITQRPDLFSGALVRVGCSNPLRMELTPNGPPNITEFGTFKEEEGFKALYAMDAYQHVEDGKAYPAVMLTAGINDPRVDPMQASKMTARLQAATSSKKPILLRVDYDGGHGMGSTLSQHDIEYADEMSFLLWQSGDAEFVPAKL